MGRPQLALRFGGLAGLAHQFGVEGVRVEHRVRVGDHEQRHRRQRGGGEAHEHPLPGVRPRPPQAQDGGRQQRHEHDPGRVLGGARQTEARARQQVVAEPSFPEHPRGPEQRGRQRRQRGHVVQRQVRVEGRQERHRLDRRRQQPGRPPDQAGTDEVQQPQGERAEDRRGDAGQFVDRRRVVLEAADDAAAAPVGDREQEVEHVREGRRVGEVVRVQRPLAEHPHRPRDEVIGFVDVEHEREPLAGAPQPQREPAREHHRQRRPGGQAGARQGP